MSLLTKRHHTPHKRAKWLLAIIGWVVVVCLMQNSGFASSCSMKYETEAPAVSLTDERSSVKSIDTKETSKCELSEKLIQFSQHQLDVFIVVLFVGLFASAIWLCSAYIGAQHWTEPIGRKYRVHLTFCVFRE
ncbi:hypothetical protein REH77_04220 [Vibrio alginolyticus]|uniref:hypothetical protein n=1 Tax=Vibrio TaxID=662 RepID=UPI00063D8BBA|nr:MULTISPECIES: hypothetical protein [Vibrio]EKA3120667.1 hypothetical protein [Vibrio alginolyticus]ELA7316450.1 hypothetical protein [Vibrio alginolyticus]KLI70864.1 membrane protein [Vibrio alginolyticus]MDM4739915.1 hypothetical protein [Vibrio alginolyticus]MDM4760264.1 hypothetical protein [Vibrio alginolyticus]